jgi:hypothetical protein
VQEVTGIAGMVEEAGMAASQRLGLGRPLSSTIACVWSVITIAAPAAFAQSPLPESCSPSFVRQWAAGESSRAAFLQLCP